MVVIGGGQVTVSLGSKESEPSKVVARPGMTPGESSDVSRILGTGLLKDPSVKEETLDKGDFEKVVGSKAS